MFDVIFFLFTFLAFIGFIIGLIKPDKVIRWGEKKTRKQVALVYGIAIIVFFILFAITIPPPEKKGEIKPEITQSTQEQKQEQEPFLEIIHPKEFVETENSYIFIKGKTNVGTKIKVQSNEVSVDESGIFQQKVELSIGKNPIEIIADNGYKEKKIILTIKRLTEQEIAERKLSRYIQSLPKFLSFICSKPENSHTSFYYLINSYCPTNQIFPLLEKITDVTVRLSTIQGKTGWDIQFLCSPETKFDLPSYQWQILTAGADCGLGAAIRPCNINFISDSTGVTGIIISPDIKGYTTRIMGEYCKKDALLKVTGKIVK